MVVAHSTQFKRAFLGFSTLALFALAPLSAEDNGAFIQGGFQYSNFNSTTTSVVKPTGEQDLVQAVAQLFTQQYMQALKARGVPEEQARQQLQVELLGVERSVKRAYPNGLPGSKSSTTYNGNLYGADIQIGYKQFFGQSKHFGLRYYGIFSGQGGSYYNKDGKYSQPSANLFYGAGVDALYNFYESNDRTYGIFAGVMIGGSSWLMGEAKNKGKCVFKDKKGICGSMNDSYSDLAKSNKIPITKATFSPTYVQFIVNVGFRTNFTKHQGFEFGVRIPTIDDPYYKTTLTGTQLNVDYQSGELTGGRGKGSGITLAFRRNVALYWNYVYNF
ncbi:outer membrane protein [Helicobacter felis]|uniref:outer membrane protein n=1 Tax=Helicobacter felis TaxID=214 RepID=UPI000CF16C88|nr:outer membrane protein [Helicobacter felis]